MKEQKEQVQPIQVIDDEWINDLEDRYNQEYNNDDDDMTHSVKQNLVLDLL